MVLPSMPKALASILTFTPCLNDCSIAVKSLHNLGNSYERQHLGGLAYSLRSLFYLHHAGIHGSLQANARTVTKSHILILRAQSLPTVTDFLKQGHTS